MVTRVDGIMVAAELGQCVEATTSEAVVARAVAWKGTARVAVADGGSSNQNLEFLRQIEARATIPRLLS